MKIVLSIIILNYNTKKITIEAIKSIEKNCPKEVQSGEYEVIVADNASPDNSLAAFKEYKKQTKIKSFLLVDNKKNLGFAAGNNKAVAYTKGRYVLFLNPDTIVNPETLPYMIKFLESHADAGAATCKIISPEGKLDANCLRGFPTPWNAFCHFAGLGKLFPKMPLFAGYLQSGWRNLDKMQQVDAIEGAFMMLPRKIGEEIGWFDEDYFFYGEDLQLCFDIHKAGFKIYYVPQVSIVHYSGASSGIKKESQNITTADIQTKKKVQTYRFDAMRIFYKKNYSHLYPAFFNWLAFQGIEYLQKKNLKKLK